MPDGLLRAVASEDQLFKSGGFASERQPVK